MHTTVRTTIRIRKDLLDQTRLIALKNGDSLQDTINDTLALGFKHISDLDSAQEAMKRINDFRNNLAKKKVNLKKILAQNKVDQR